MSHRLMVPFLECLPIAAPAPPRVEIAATTNPSEWNSGPPAFRAEGMRKLILRNGLSPGDIVMLTAAVRDLHRCYPHQFLTDVRTCCPALWKNNPYLTPLHENDPEVHLLECDYPLIGRSNQAPYHCLHGFVSFLNEQLGLHIQPSEFRGDIHLSLEEKSWVSQVQELTGEDTPFWIVVAGGKFDVTIKWWETSRYQRVIDHFRGRLQFVQVGEAGHHHPKLAGVIDLRGRTDLRQLIRLVYHSQGILCGVTAAMHLAAAVETKHGSPPHRPCVVIAGAREPAHWEAYPHHQFIHTIGQLRCCAHGGCWKSRTVPLGDGDERDHPDRLCQDVIEQLPRCMALITPERVIDRIEDYFRGGALNFLTPAEALGAEKGVFATSKNVFQSGAPAKLFTPAQQRGTLLIQQGSGIYGTMLDLTHERHAAFAQRHGLCFWNIRGDVQFERHPAWNKIILIQMGLALGFDQVIWLDADTLIVDSEKDPREVLPPDASLGMCRHPIPWQEQPWHHNSGVIFVRNTTTSRLFFESVWSRGEVDHPWHEQIRINEISAAQPNLIVALDPIWNSTAGVTETQGAVIRAWHGKGQEAIPSLKAALAALAQHESNRPTEKRHINGHDRHIRGSAAPLAPAAAPDSRP